MLCCQVFFIFETVCIHKTFFKMRKNPNRIPKNDSTPTNSESENESVPEAVPDQNELPESVVDEAVDRSRPVVFKNPSGDVRSTPEFKKYGWDCVKLINEKTKKKFEEGRKKKVEEWKNKTAVNGKKNSR